MWNIFVSIVFIEFDQIHLICPHMPLPNLRAALHKASSGLSSSMVYLVHRWNKPHMPRRKGEFKANLHTQ